MLFEDFLEKRGKRIFTAADIETHINERKLYRCKVFDTYYSGDSRWSRTQFWKDVTEFNDPKIPEHFAYIKFYTEAETENSEKEKIYALVAGKTRLKSREILFQIEEDKKFSISEIDCIRKDKAKKWLGAQKETCRWCYEKIMIVWSPKAEKEGDEKAVENLALSAEADIGGLFGLFSS